MSRKRRNRGPQRRPVHITREHPQADGFEDQALIQSLRRAIRSDEPLDLLSTVGALLEVTDPRAQDPHSSRKPATTREQLLESFIDIPYAETTAVLMVMRSLVADEFTRSRINAELARRRHPMPAWLTRLEEAVAEPSVFCLTHVLKDGDDFLIGVILPTGHQLSALIYVDTNMGMIVKDAFVVPEPLEDLVIKLGSLADDPDQSLTRIDPAHGRAQVEAAIATAAMYWPPVESDTWPMCRPLVEWMLRKLPAGGHAEEIPEWSDKQLAAIAKDFFGSPFGRPLDRVDERDLLEGILWFAKSGTGGDPYRWSNVRVEVLLDDWFPRQVVAPVSYLTKMPHVLRAYVRYCHDRQGIRAQLTQMTLEAIDRYEPQYQRKIRSQPNQGAAGSAMPPYSELADMSLEEIVLTGLAAEVGGPGILQSLDDDPLPDEPFVWAEIPEDIHPVVQEVLEGCDRLADEVEDVEYRTAMRRFLSWVAASDPAIFRRKASTMRAAAAVAWAISQANNLFTAKSIQEWFGLNSGVSKRAEPMLAAIGVNPHAPRFGRLDLGTPELLVSARRARIISKRDRAEAGYGL